MTGRTGRVGGPADAGTGAGISHATGGRFPGFSVLDQAGRWDPVTAGVVLSRVGWPPDIRFFTPAEEAAATALCDRLLGQDGEPKVPVVPQIDARLAEQSTDGWRYADMPEDGQAWRHSLRYLDADCQAASSCVLAEATADDQRAVIQAVQDLGAKDWQGLNAADPINPMRLFHELSTRLPADAIVAADSGSSANWYARQLKFHGQVRGSLSGNLATMGPGVPYGIGAKFGHPDRPVIVFEGDGAMQMNGLAELITIKHYWQEWADPRLIIAVLHNDDLNQVTWEMRAMEGAPKFTESQTLPDVDYAAFATSLGLQGINVGKPDDLGPAWDRALAADRPTLLDVRVDPSVPPIPPHATFEQAKDAARALLKGDEDARSVIVEGIKTKVQEFLPHSGD